MLAVSFDKMFNELFWVQFFGLNQEIKNSREIKNESDRN